MSFDIFFNPCRLGTEKVEMKNPFTKTVESVFPHELDDQDLKRVQAVLKKFHAGEPDSFDRFVVPLEDGHFVEVFGADIKRGCMIAVRGFSPVLLEFLVELLKAAKWIMMPMMDETIAIAASERVFQMMAPPPPEMDLKMIVSDSPPSLKAILEGGYQNWSDFRDHVVERQRDKPL
jgi:hypothetical protein